MRQRRLVDAWRAGQRKGYRLKEVQTELSSHGFSVEPLRRHWVARHPALNGHPEFLGRIVFSVHAHGNQGEIHPEAIRDFVRAIDWIEST